jgi:hypothetical protein
MQLAPAARLDPDLTVKVLGDLESWRLVDHTSTGTIGPYSGIYALTEPGVRAARQLLARDKSS